MGKKKSTVREINTSTKRAVHSAAFAATSSPGPSNPWPRLLKYSKNRGVFCHVTHDEMAFFGGWF